MRKFAIFVALMVVASAITIETFYDADPQQCIEEKCPSQWAACQKDSKCVPALQDCEKKCGTSKSCWTLCLPSKGSQAAVDVAKCADANKCLGITPEVTFDAYSLLAPQDCIREKCPDQLKACEKDNKCFPALQDCEKECLNSTTCWTTCLSKKGNTAASNLYKCIQDNNCFANVAAALAFADPQQCIEEKCPTQWAACQKDSKCVPALQDCEKKCGTSKSCWTLCLPSKGSQAAVDVAKCADANKCLGMPLIEASTAVALADPQQCIEEKCPTQWATCQKDPKCIAALDDCQKKCGTSESCWLLCIPGKGNQAAVDVAKCGQANKCLGSTQLAVTGPQECIEQYCKTQEQACENDRRCIATLSECDSRCNTNLTCWNGCLSRAGNKNASDYVKCLIDNKCLNATNTAVALADPQQCIEEKCPTQWAACQKDSKCVPALQDCEKKCGTSKSCWTLCLPSKGSQAAVDVAKCADANKCLGSFLFFVEEVSTAVALADPQQCIEEKCPTQWAACQKDSKCVPALQDCEKKCGTSKSCWTLCLPSKGSQAAVDVAKCADANKCLGVEPVEVSTAVALADPQQCIEEKCPTQWAACQKDSKCVPALQDCEKKCGTSKSCWTLCLPSKGSQAAVDVAKCADANKCLGMPYAFETCMSKSCFGSHMECLSNWECRASLRKCRTGLKAYDFDLECLAAESKQSSFISSWFTCAGESFCL